MHRYPFPRGFCHRDDLVVKDDRAAVEGGGGTHLPGGNIYFNTHPETLHRNTHLANLQCGNRNLYKITSFYFTSLFSQFVRSWVCSDLVSSQSNVTKSHQEPGTKQNQAELVVYDVTNKSGDNLRSTQEASLSTSLGPPPITIILKTLLPVLFPGIHENDRNFPHCTSSGTGVTTVNHCSLQVSVCPQEPGRSCCPTRQWYVFAQQLS